MSVRSNCLTTTRLGSKLSNLLSARSTGHARMVTYRGDFIMQVVDNRAFSVMFAVLFSQIPGLEYTGVF